MQLYFEVQGKGEPLVVLHGLFGSGENWVSIGRALADAFRVYLVDLRNHGRSPHIANMSYPEMAEDLFEFAEEQKLSRFSLLGHSMGGKTAMQFALQHSERVRRLVVVDIAPRQYAPRHLEILTALTSLELNSFQTRTEIEEALAPRIPELAVRRFLLKNLKRDPGGKFRWQMNLAALSKDYARLNQDLNLAETFEQPALFLLGGQSDYVGDADWPLIHRFFPRAEIQSIPEAGHWVHAEAQTHFIRIVREFLLRNGAAGPGRSVLIP
jgi:esterase